MMVSKLATNSFKATQNQGRLGNKSQDTLKSKLHVTDIVLCCKKATGGFEYIASPINGAGEDELPLNTVVQSQGDHGSETDPFESVAITDGQSDSVTDSPF